MFCDEHTTLWDLIKYRASLDVDIEAINKKIDTEALEAHNRVSRHGDSI